MLGFFALVALTLELYFILFHRELPARAATQLFARLFAIYGAADSHYYDPVSPLALALESINVFVMQPLCMLLVYAIVRRRPYRWPLQLGVGAYLALSVVLYFLVAIVSGYDGMAERNATSFALFYGGNLPWLAGYAWLALDAGVVIAGRFDERAGRRAPRREAHAAAGKEPAPSWS